jgi:hypothetical protein
MIASPTVGVGPAFRYDRLADPTLCERGWAINHGVYPGTHARSSLHVLFSLPRFVELWRRLKTPVVVVGALILGKRIGIAEPAARAHFCATFRYDNEPRWAETRNQEVRLLVKPLVCVSVPHEGSRTRLRPGS